MCHSAIIVDGEIYEFTVDGLVQHRKGSPSAVNYFWLHGLLSFSHHGVQKVKLTFVIVVGAWRKRMATMVDVVIKEIALSFSKMGSRPKQIYVSSQLIHFGGCSEWHHNGQLSHYCSSKHTYRIADNNCHDFVTDACQFLEVPVPSKVREIVSKCRSPQ